MPHPLVTQLRFTREEWIRGLKGVSPEDAIKRFEPMNCISWMIGHLAHQEHTYWIMLATGKVIAPQLSAYGFGQPATTPPLNEMWDLWHTVTKESDKFLNTVTTRSLQTTFEYNDKPVHESPGTMLLRMIHHYWYHLGESQAVRQLLGHKDLPAFVGSMHHATYTPE